MTYATHSFYIINSVVIQNLLMKEILPLSMRYSWYRKSLMHQLFATLLSLLPDHTLDLLEVMIQYHHI